MSGEVKIPGIGPVKKGYAYAGVALVMGIVGYAYYRRKNHPAAAADTPAATTPDSSTPTSPYTQPSDGSGYSPYPAQQPYSPYGYDIYGNPLPAPTGLYGGGAYTTNSAWAEAAEAALENTGLTLATAATAVTRVLGGLSVTSTQQGYFLQAVGTLGQPPQGYPKPIHVVDPTTGGDHTGTPHKPSGLHAAHVDRTSIRLDWSAVTGATGYKVYLDGHEHAAVTTPPATVDGLRPHTTHSLGVAATANGKTGPQATIHVATHK